MKEKGLFVFSLSDATIHLAIVWQNVKTLYFCQKYFPFSTVINWCKAYFYNTALTLYVNVFINNFFSLEKID